MEGRRRAHGHWAWMLALMLSVVSTGWTIEPPATTGRGAAVEEIIKSWESVDARLTSLLGELPSAAHGGVQRAIEANRQGRARALAALEGAGEENAAAGRERAQQALADAQARAERGLNEARRHVPDNVLSRLDEAAAGMRDGIAKGNSAVATGSPVAAPSSRPQIDRPGGMPADAGRPGAAGKPQTPPRPRG